MAVAGKVAITLSTENGGAWSADVTYDRLVAVKHNNNLYISRKTVANVEPPNDEFWFLALEGFGGDDVQALIDRMNELRDLIQAIINGTTQVGNAKTLDGHGEEYFAPLADLANYLPLTGGKITGTNDIPISLDGIGQTLIRFLTDGVYKGYFGFDANGNLVTKVGTSAWSNILHTGNKPSGTYTGNGDATGRTVAVGGIGNCLMVRRVSSEDFSIVSESGYIGKKGSMVVCGADAYYSRGGQHLYMATISELFNASGGSYYYELL